MTWTWSIPAKAWRLIDLVILLLGLWCHWDYIFKNPFLKYGKLCISNKYTKSNYTHSLLKMKMDYQPVSPKVYFLSSIWSRMVNSLPNIYLKEAKKPSNSWRWNNLRSTVTPFQYIRDFYQIEKACLYFKNLLSCSFFPQFNLLLLLLLTS